MRIHSNFRSAAGMVLIAAVTALGQTAPGQAAQPPLAFEVASIKPSPPIDPAAIMSGQARIGMHVNAARVDFAFTPMIGLIMAAYKVKPFQVNGPSWINATMFDVVAKLPDGATKEQIPEMLQALLAERFKMTVHHESKEHGEFNLVVAKGGAKLKEAEPEPAGAADEPLKPGEMTTDSPEGRSRMSFTKDGTFHSSGPGIEVSGGMKNNMLHIDATRITMKAFAEMLSQFAGTPVVDKTEIKGSYQMTFDFALEELMAMARANGAMGGMGGGPAPAPGQGPASAASDPSGPSIAAMVQQYGLKLVSLKTPMDFIVIDHIEKTPTEN
jgi:uncharacterized protein (TIGR03435 family)